MFLLNNSSGHELAGYGNITGVDPSTQASDHLYTEDRKYYYSSAYLLEYIINNNQVDV